MPFHAASAGSLSAFLAVEAAVAAMFVLGARAALGASSRRVLLRVLLWLGVLVAIVASGVVERMPMPGLPLLLALALGPAAAFACSATGARLAALPLPALVAFQGFRLPLELVLHAWAEGGTIPATMTWTGQNVDILSGVVALVAAPFAARHRVAAWVASIVGTLLLANVLRVVVMSSPLPFAWPVEPTLQLAFHLPYATILPVCVGGALAGHIVLLRALLRRARVAAG